MKKSLWVFLLVFSLNSYADQGEILAQGRDYLIDQAIATIKNYCINYLPQRSPESTYICRLQITADCSQTSEKQKNACEVLAKVQEIEKNIVLSDKNISQVEPTPLYSSKPVTSEEPKKILVPIKPVLIKLNIKRGSSLEYASPKTEEAIAESNLIDSMVLKINSLKLRNDCSSDSDCRFQEYGKKICGGPVGVIVYSALGDEHKTLLEDIPKFTAADSAFQKKRNKDVMGTCDSNAREEPAKCKNNVCM